MKYPESDQRVPAHYARAYAYHLGGYPDKALSEADAMLATDPHDPFFLELKGQILLEGGKPVDAIAALREATQRSGDMPLIAAMLGHALVATDDPKNFPEAKQVLKAAVSRDNQNPFAWFQLGIIYDREGDQSRARPGERRALQPGGQSAAGDVSARTALSTIELAWDTAQAEGVPLEERHVDDAARKRPLRYDKGADQHYDFVSAFIKSMRGSDPDAAVYYLASMLEGGEDPRFIARRMVIFASEDVGNADPRGLQVAVAAAHALEHVGLPEAQLNLSQAAIYLANAPKIEGERQRDLVGARGSPAPRGPCGRPPCSATRITRARRSSGTVRATSIPTPTLAAPKSTACRRAQGTSLLSPFGNGEEAIAKIKRE